MEGNLHIIVCSVWAMVFADSYWENFSFRFPEVIYITNFLIWFFFFLSPANHLLYGNRALCLILTKQYK